MTVREMLDAAHENAIVRIYVKWANGEISDEFYDLLTDLEISDYCSAVC